MINYIKQRDEWTKHSIFRTFVLTRKGCFKPAFIASQTFIEKNNRYFLLGRRKRSYSFFEQLAHATGGTLHRENQQHMGAVLAETLQVSTS